MAGLYTFDVNQRVRIKQAGGSGHRPPPESAKGGFGTIAPQQTDDWAGTKLEFPPDTIVTYYVTIDRRNHRTDRHRLAGAGAPWRRLAIGSGWCVSCVWWGYR